jgi:hypothetical protein
MKKTIVIIFLLLILAGSWIAYRMYNKPPRDPTTESSTKITAVDLFRSYETNEEEANGRYLDKVLEVSGKVIEITNNQENFPVIILETDNPMFAVRCTMEKAGAFANVGDTVKIKGICTGYLSDVIVIKGTIVE